MRDRGTSYHFCYVQCTMTTTFNDWNCTLPSIGSVGCLMLICIHKLPFLSLFSFFFEILIRKFSMFLYHNSNALARIIYGLQYVLWFRCWYCTCVNNTAGICKLEKLIICIGQRYRLFGFVFSPTKKPFHPWCTFTFFLGVFYTRCNALVHYFDCFLSVSRCSCIACHSLLYCLP